MGSQVFHFLLVFFGYFLHGASSESVILDARPTILQHSGENITLAWKGVNLPTKYDWLGIYTPPTSPDDQHIGYILLSSCSTWTTGACSLQIPLVNMRAPYSFRIFRGVFVNVSASTNVTGSNNGATTISLDREGNPLPDVTKRLAASPVVQFSNYNEPTQIHLALSSDETAVRVMFVTRDPLRSQVRFGEDGDELGNTVDATSVTYSQIDMCDEPASSYGWRSPGYIHNVVMGGLNPGSRYFYRVGSNVGGWSSTYSFIAPHPRADETNALIFGDMGTSIPYSTYQYTQSESKNTVKWLTRDLEQIGDKPSFVAHIGDISYARGLSWLWDNFFTQIEPVAARSPYHVCMGNHEYDWPGQPFKPDWSPYQTDGGGECGVPYSLRFIMPGNSSLPTGTTSPATKNLYYSIDVGVVHFLFYSTETDFQVGSPQYTFIANDLRTVDRNKTPFVVFLGHRPLYTTDYRALLDTMTQKLVQTFEPLLIDTNVTVAFCGHVHKYERMCPLKNYTCIEPSKANGELPIHMVVGMGGADHQPIDDPLPSQSQPIFPQPSWSVFRTFEWGYIRLHATRHLMTISYVGNHDGKVHDVVEIPVLDDIKSGAYVESRESFFDTASGVQIPCGRSENIVAFLFVLALGYGCGAAATLFFMRRQQRKQIWQPVNREEASSSQL